MIKVITYGTYDLLHHGHLRLLERAKSLGDYLIVGVTADSFDRERGKINVQQHLMERIEAVRATGLADEIIVEEYEGQKIDDIKKYEVDVFTVGSDWEGKFDYLKEYCQVIYLDRTEGVSSSQARAKKREVHIGLVGNTRTLIKFINEAKYVNGVHITGICTENTDMLENINQNISIVNDLDELLRVSDAIYVESIPSEHYQIIKRALSIKKHILCQSPLTLSSKEWVELKDLAAKQDCILMDAIKTAYSLAYYHLLLLVKSGKIGKIISIDATCTSLENINNNDTIEFSKRWNSICSWGPFALLPIFQLLGVNYLSKNIITKYIDEASKYDAFTKISFIYPEAVASIKVGKGIKSEGNLVITGTKGYVYVPSPWWKTDYFEIRYEDFNENKRYFYQLEGEGIRHEIAAFVKCIMMGKDVSYISNHDSFEISKILEEYYFGLDVIKI